MSSLLSRVSASLTHTSSSSADRRNLCSSHASRRRWPGYKVRVVGRGVVGRGVVGRGVVGLWGEGLWVEGLWGEGLWGEGLWGEGGVGSERGWGWGGGDGRGDEKGQEGEKREKLHVWRLWRT